MVLTTPSARKGGPFASRTGNTYSLFTNTLSDLARPRPTLPDRDPQSRRWRPACLHAVRSSCRPPGEPNFTCLGRTARDITSPFVDPGTPIVAAAVRGRLATVRLVEPTIEPLVKYGQPSSTRMLDWSWMQAQLEASGTYWVPRDGRGWDMTSPCACRGSYRGPPKGAIPPPRR